MKSITKLTLVFLIALYITPLLFISSYSHTAILEEPNLVKDFQVAENWYNESWAYRRSIAITGSSGAGSGYQVRILMSYEAHMDTDFDDIRFTDNDGDTLLDHWRESYVASAYALFWVKVADNLDSDRSIFLYYGNSTVSSASNGTATFPNLYDDWTVESMQASIWDQVDALGAVSWNAAGATHGTILKLEGGAANGRQTYDSDYTSAASFALMFRANIELTTNLGANTLRAGSSPTVDAWAYVTSNNGAQTFQVRDSDANDDIQAMTDGYFDSFIVYQITRDGTNAKLYADTVLIETASCDPDVDDGAAAYLQCRDEEYDLYVDWVAVRNYIADEPASGSFGEEISFLEFVPDQWNEAGEANLYFNVPFDMWGMDTALIILGLVMVPTSGLYLVKGGRSEASMDKLFFALIAFMIGWALVIGGIMP